MGEKELHKQELMVTVCTYLDFLEPVCALSDIIVVLEWIVDDDYWTNVAIEIGLDKRGIKSGAPTSHRVNDRLTSSVF